MKATLSVSMIVRDESAHLAVALENLRQFADEVVVLDTGSTDDTKRLAEAAGAVVRDFQWCDDFAKARNASLSLCTQQFVMWLDADDRIPAEDARRLRRLLEGPIDWDVLCLPYLYSQTMRKKPVRVFRNGLGIHWIYPIHEILNYPRPVRKRRDVEDICIYHAAERPAGAHSARNLHILEKAILRPEYQNSAYMLWHIAKEYSALREHPKAIYYFRQAAKWASPGEPFMISRLYTGLARQYRRLGKLAQAMEELGKAALFYPQWREPYCGMADALWELGDPHAANVCVAMAREVPKHQLTVERIALYDEASFARDYVERARRLAEVAEKKASAAPRPSPAVGVLAAGGDVCLARQMQGYVSKHGAGWPLQEVRDLFRGADVALVNLECVVSDTGRPLDKQGRRPFYYRAHPGLLDVLCTTGVGVVTTANNHAMDYGADALLQSNARLQRVGIRPCGSGRSLAEASRPCYVQAKGMVMAIVAIDTEESHFAATPTAPGVNHARGNDLILRRLAASLAEARNRADLIVVSPHWGANWKEHPTAERISLAHQIIDLGADAVLGHSAHILQGIEIYAGCPIVYDMGSLLFDRVSESRMNRSAVFCLPFGSDGFTQVRVYPVILERGRARRAAGRQFDEICGLLKTLSRPLGTMDWIMAEDHVALDLAPSQRRSRPPRAADPSPIGVEVDKSLHGCSAGEFPEVVLDSPPPWADFVSNEDIVFLGSRIPEAVAPGFAYVAEILLRVSGPLIGRWEGSIEAFGATGELRYHWVHPLADGATCPTRWQAGQLILDRTIVRPPRDLGEGVYELFFHLVDRDSERTICPLASSRRVVDHRIYLGSIKVTANASKEVAGMDFFRS